jgi:hypothetical protein
MKKILPMLIAGFGAAVLSIVPILKGFSCCLLIPFASMMSLFLDIRVNKNLDRIRISKAVWFGFLTGFFATIFFVSFDLIITFITKTNDLIESLPQSEMIINQMNLGDLAKEPMKLMRSMADEIKANGFSLLYAFLIFFSNFITNSIFGIIGGLVGMGILNKKRENISE